MSETKKKRVNKTEEEIRMELEKQQALKFWEEIREVEQKHKMRIRAYLREVKRFDFIGATPFLTAEPIEEVTVTEEKTAKEA